MSIIGTRIGKPAYLATLRALRPTLGNQADVRRRTAHIEGDRVVDARQRGDPLRADHAACGTGDEDHGGVRGGLLDRCDSAGGAHHERLGEPCLASRQPEGAQVARDDRPEVCVGGGRRAPLVLAELRRHLVRGNHVGLGVATAELPSDGLLVRGILEREQQADGDRLRVDPGQGREVERDDDAVPTDPLAYPHASLQRNQRLGVVEIEPVQMRTILSAQVQQVLEALRRDERRARSLPLEERIRGDRRPVTEAREPGASGGYEHGPRGFYHRLLLARTRRHLGAVDAPAFD